MVSAKISAFLLHRRMTKQVRELRKSAGDSQLLSLYKNDNGCRGEMKNLAEIHLFFQGV
jgi:hypothetical protein